ncbi:MAG: hypothetical protein MJ058_03085 [Akkermansia sp.]|nr:hypothetical protein [Akkermansia sp.]
MKLRVSRYLVAALLASYAQADEPVTTTNVGSMLFMGDSITHGVVDQTYRWQMFKTFVDNGITFDLNGPKNGYGTNPPKNMNDAGDSYGGIHFDNDHYAQSSGRSGDMLTGNRYGYKVADVGKTDYNTYTLMIGTNDILSDTGSGSGISYGTYIPHMEGLLGGTVTYTGDDKSLSATWNWTMDPSNMGNMGAILDAMNLNAGDNFYVLSIPVWAYGHNNHNVASDHAAVVGYNSMLQQWVQAYDAKSPANVKYVDINTGLSDVTIVSTQSEEGPYDFFRNNDRLHPSQQGSIIIAANLARGMGLAGRTAGLHRSATTAAADGWTAPQTASITLNSGDSQDIVRNVFIEDQGYTIDFHANFGDGEQGGWKDAGIHRGSLAGPAQNVLAITVGDGLNGGVLNLAEGYIMWGDSILYCQDNSQTGNENIRIAFHNGNEAQNVVGGYYVWLGDMLIGQGLTSTPGLSFNGVTVSATGGTATLTDIMYANTAYAPTTQYAAGEAPYLVVQDAGRTDLVPTRTPMPTHNNTPVPSTVDWSIATPASYDGSVKADHYAVNTAGTGTATVSITVTKAANQSWLGAKGGNNVYTGDINMEVKEGSYGSATVFGVVNGNTADGNVTVELNSSNAVYSSFTGSNAASLIGGYKGSITGTFTGVVNKGTLQNGIIGGFHTKDNGNHIGAVNLVVNGGTVGGNVYGGSIVDAAIDKDISITMTGGQVNGSIIGSGTAGTVGGDINIRITGGIINGDVVGSQAGATVKGTTSVTVESYMPLITGSITADHVTLKGVQDTEYSGGMDSYQGVVTGKSTITLEDYTAGNVLAELRTQSLKASGTTDTTVRNLKLTACDISVDAGAKLTLADKFTLANAGTFSGEFTLADGLVLTLEDLGGNNRYSDGANGYLDDVVVMSRAADAAAGSTIHVGKVQGGGALQGAVFSYDETTGNLVAGDMTSGSYFINRGTVYYGGSRAPEDIKTAHDLLMQPTSGATLVMASNFEPDCAGGIIVKEGAQGARLHINAKEEVGDRDIVVNASMVHAAAALAVEGEGTYAISGETAYNAGNGYGLGANVSLDPFWMGTLLVTASTSTDNNNLMDFSKLGNRLSTVELNGLTGWATNWAGGTIDQNIKLTDNEGKAAWKNAASNSKGTEPLTEFTGEWSGDGTFEVSPGNSNQRSNYTFSGDISAWNGKLLRSGQGTTTFTIAGKAHEVNADIERTGGTVTLVVDTDTVFKGDVTNMNALTVNAGKHVTFAGNTTLASGATATLNATVYNQGTMTLAGTVAADLTHAGAYDVYAASAADFDGTGAYAGSGHATGDTVAYYIIKGADGSALNGADSVQVTGGTRVAGAPANSLVLSTTADKSLYYVNKDLAYDSSMDAGTTGLVIARGTTLQVESNQTVSNKVLHGSGTYCLNGKGTLGSSVSLDGADWTGTVKVKGSVDNLNLSSGGGLYTANSSVSLDGWLGYFNGAPQITAAVEIASGGANIYDGSSGNTITFAGALTGSGNITRVNTNNRNATINLAFTGDVADFTGSFIHDRCNSVAFNLTFSGSADTVNAKAFTAGSVSAGSLNITFAAADTVVNSEITRNTTSQYQQHKVNVTAEENVMFNNTLNVDTLTVNGGKTAYFTTDVSVDTLAGSGTIVLAGEGSDLTVKGSVAAGVMIEAGDGATIGGAGISADKVGIAADATATLVDGVTTLDVVFAADEGGVKVTNNGSQTAVYSTADADMLVHADTLSKTGTGDVTVNNQLDILDVVNTTGGKLTLSADEVLELHDMTLTGQNAAVEVLDREKVGQEAKVSIGGTLTAGGGTLLANLELQDGATLDVAGQAMTLGSELTLGKNLYLDAATMRAMDAMEVGETHIIISDYDGNGITFAEEYDGAWYGSLFNRVSDETETAYHLVGDYTIVATPNEVGFYKVSMTPEPTTGTLSVLALAALAARRRKRN